MVIQTARLRDHRILGRIKLGQFVWPFEAS